jgi:hypothetical protein
MAYLSIWKLAMNIFVLRGSVVMIKKLIFFVYLTNYVILIENPISFLLIEYVNPQANLVLPSDGY